MSNRWETAAGVARNAEETLCAPTGPIPEDLRRLPMSTRPVVEMTTTKGTIRIELFEQEAPNTVANFVSLIDKKFYDGLTFHRVIPNFMIQGGCPRGDGTGGPGYKIKCETGAGKPNHVRGSLSMAHAGKDTGGSQFFICHSAQPHLDRVHTVFGQVVEGLSVVDAITAGDRMTAVRVIPGTPAPQ